MIAPYLTKLQTRLRPHGIQVGSYPALGQGVFVSLIGRDRPLTTAITTPSGDTPEFQENDEDNEDGNRSPPRLWLAEVAREVEQEVDGQVVSEEEVAKRKGRCKELATPVEMAASMGVQPEKPAHTFNNLKAKY
jgi:hypothetical protein